MRKIAVATFNTNNLMLFMKRLATFACLTALTLPAIAGLLDDDEARKAILDLRAEVRNRDADQSQKNQQLTDQLSSLGIASANSMAKLRNDLAEQSKQIDTLRSNILDLNTALKNTREDNAKLRGMIEVAQNNLQLSTKELQAAKLRQQELEAANDARLKKLEPRTVSVDGKEALVDKAEEASFNSALNQFKAADYKSASRAFETFTVQYPQSGLIQTALFWLGNSQFAAKDPKAGLATLQGMMQKFPQHARAADAHLTMGHCYDELGDKKRSVELYNYVIKTFPSTPAAQAAQEALPKPVAKPAAKKKIQ
jgi:tol-pal system protein YbgF